MSSFTEDALIEQPAIALLGKLGWETANCFAETFGPAGMLRRETPGEVLLFSRLHSAPAARSAPAASGQRGGGYPRMRHEYSNESNASSICGRKRQPAPGVGGILT